MTKYFNNSKNKRTTFKLVKPQANASRGQKWDKTLSRMRLSFLSNLVSQSCQSEPGRKWQKISNNVTWIRRSISSSSRGCWYSMVRFLKLVDEPQNLKKKKIFACRTRRKNLITSFLYRGAVNFQTLVYDSNVGDIAPLSMYFNPRKWTVLDLNEKFGQVADQDDRSETSSNLTIGPWVLLSDLKFGSWHKFVAFTLQRSWYEECNTTSAVGHF